MKIDFEQIIHDNFREFLLRKDEVRYYEEEEVKEFMRQACKQTIDEAIRSFPSHEYPEITKPIL